MAWRSEPAPLSAVVVTVKVAPRLKLAQSQTHNSGIHHLPFEWNKNFTWLGLTQTWMAAYRFISQETKVTTRLATRTVTTTKKHGQKPEMLLIR